jgi:glyoxylase-like metal-dependent hydrolase (beta-lactamase superfamily II)
MHRRSFLQTSLLAAGGLALLNKHGMGTLFQDPWQIKMLRNNIGIFTEKGGTIAFLLSKNGIVTVDSEFPEQSQHLITELKKKSDKPFQWLINTHHHGDHSSGNISFKGIVGHVLAHENSLKNQKNVAVAQKTEDKQLYPDQTYTDKRSEKVDDETITLYYYGAGHTDGDSLVHFEKANIVHLGDLLFNRRHPFVDRSAGANIHSWIQVLDKAKKKFDRQTLFVYGHSADGYEVTGNTDDLSAFQEYLGQLMSFTEKEIKAGKTKEEILKTTTLPFETTWKGDGLQRPLEAAYEELKAI